MAAAARVRDRDVPATPASDVYVGLLGVSLVALILGCVFLALDWMEYPTTKAPGAPQYTGLPKEAGIPAPQPGLPVGKPPEKPAVP